MSPGPAVRPAHLGELWGLVNGFTTYFSVLAADEIGVFDAVADGEVEVEGIARRCGADRDRLRALLDANVAAGTLECREDGYSLSPLAEAHLVTERPGYLGGLLRRSPGPFENWPALAATVRGARPPRDVGGERGEFLAELVRTTFPVQLEVARATLGAWAHPQIPASCRVLELGAGAAPWSVAVLEQFPAATAVVNDLPGVLPLAAGALGERGLLARTELAEGSYWEVEPPDGAFDLVVLGHVCRAEGDRRAQELIGRAGAAAAPGGRVVLTEYLLDDDRSGPAQAQLLGVTMMASTEKGATFTRGQAVAWLEKAGLHVEGIETRVPPTSVVVACKPAAATGVTRSRPDEIQARRDLDEIQRRRQVTSVREKTRVETLVDGAVVVTMDEHRRVIGDGAVAISGSEIAAVGPAWELRDRFEADQVIDGRRFVVTPGLINTHIHVTGEPLTRGFVPDDTPFEENVFTWLCPLYAAHTEEDERTSAQMAAAEMLLSGTTTFLEAGTVRFTDAVADGLAEIGIRARIGRWVWDLPPEPSVYRQTTEQAIAHLEEEVAAHPESGVDALVAAWPMVVGHTTCSDRLWKAARGLATEAGTGMNFHMSPAAMDPAYFLETFGERPLQHLDGLGVLDSRTVVAHCVHVDEEEIAALARRGSSVAHCPTTALKVAYGITQIGKIPEMLEAGVNVAIGTDGANASNYSDLYRATYLVAGLFKDARRDPTQIPAELALEMATLHGARALGLEGAIGSIEVGKRADLVLHDRHRPEWTPLLNVANQLVYSADGRSVHTVFVDGRKVVDGYRLASVDAASLYHRAQRAGEGIVARSGLPDRRRWLPQSTGRAPDTGPDSTPGPGPGSAPAPSAGSG